MESAFYEPAGSGTFIATGATAGPWSPDAQHGGPPSALAARALELHEADERQRLARVCIDILRPVPVGKVSVTTRTIRPGRRVTLAEAVLEADGQEVLHARGWRIERPAGAVPEIADGGPPAPVPAEGDGLPPMIFRREEHGYMASVEWRFMPADFGEVGVVADGASTADGVSTADGASTAAEPASAAGPAPGQSDHGEYAAPRPPAHGAGSAAGGPAKPGIARTRAAWTRPRIPLLPGEHPSPMSRALLVADSGSGVGAALPSDSFIFINVDLSVTLPRDPVSDWLLLESSTSVGADGTGLATTRLSDPLGPCGRAWQTLVVAPRA